MPSRPVSSAEPVRALVGGVGYTNLRDGSAGPILAERLAGTLGPDVDVEDLSYSPIDVMFLFQRRAPYARAVFVGAVSRGSPPGTVRVIPWDPEPESPESVQERIAEAVSGVISLDNLLRINQHFKALPPVVTVVEIEPEDEGWGEGVTPTMERALHEVVALLKGDLAVFARA